jgi:hypothetical protein
MRDDASRERRPPDFMTHASSDSIGDRRHDGGIADEYRMS